MKKIEGEEMKEELNFKCPDCGCDKACLRSEGFTRNMEVYNFSIDSLDEIVFNEGNAEFEEHRAKDTCFVCRECDCEIPLHEMRDHLSGESEDSNE